MPRILLSGAAGAIAIAVAALPSSPACGDTYPTRPVTIIVALAPGTGMDTIVRLYADKLAQSLGKPMIIENRPGGAGLVAMESVNKAAADGYTLGAATSAAMAIRPTLFKTLPYDPLKDYVPIALYVKSPFVLVANPALPVHSVAELIKYLKERPGQLSFSSSSIGGAPHLSGEYMKQKFGIEMTHVPYRNSPQSIADVAAGHVALAFAEAGASGPLIKDGRLRALAVTSTMRLGTLPDVPTFAEAARVPDFEAVSWHVLFARADAPMPIVGRLHEDMKRIMELPEIRATIINLGLIPHATPSIGGIQSYIRSEIEKWGALVKSLGLAGSQ